MKIIAVILAGGSGTRLWPLSRPGTPKQFLRVFGNKTLLQNTVERISGLNPHAVIVVTGESLRVETTAQLKEIGFNVTSPESFGSPTGGRQGENAPVATILTEPAPRNTAPAVALAAAYVRDTFGADAVTVVLPADHHIPDALHFCQTLLTAVNAAKGGDTLVTLGIKPTGPETGYGYIDAGGAAGEVVKVRRFVEKPSLDKAMEYLAAGSYYWNSGMFVWTARALLAAVEAHMPELHAFAKLPWADFQAAFDESPSISVDYGIMEKAANVHVVPSTFPWSDVGTWESVAAFWREDGKLAKPSAEVESQSVDVYSKRKVAVVGLEDVLIVDADDGLLVMKKGHGQAIGNVAKSIASLPASTPQTGSTPRVVPKPWGQELIWAETEKYVGKTLTIKKGESLSLQYHRLKDETIHVLRGKLSFQFGPSPEQLEEKIMLPGESFHIRTLTVHRMTAVEDTDVLEVSTPQLDDVVRLIDRYGR